MPAAARFGRAHLAHWAPLGGPTVTLISDLPNSRRVAYVGLNNRAAGRTAAYLMARCMGLLAHSRQAHVAMIVGSLRYRAREEREAGFFTCLKNSSPWCRCWACAKARTTPSAAHLQSPA